MLKSIIRFIKDKRIKIQKVLNVIFGINSLIGLGVIVIITGFHLTEFETTICRIIIDISIAIFITQELIFGILNLIKKKSKRSLITKKRILAIILLSNFFFIDTILAFFSKIFPYISIIDMTLIYLGILQLLIIISYIFEVIRNTKLSEIKVQPGLITVVSFAVVILIGTGLLYLPKSTINGYEISFVDALFTSTSAVCVTGLTTVSIADHFSLSGQVIIFILIQTGGIGILTLATFLMVMFGGGLSFRMNVMLKDMLSEDNLGHIASVLKKITIFTFSVELVGATLMFFALNNNMYNTWIYWDVGNAASAIFHSVSSFCNAGLTLYPEGATDSILQGNNFFFGVSMCLIIIGGTGFLAFSNIFGYLLYKKNNRLKKIRRLNSTTKLIIYIYSIMTIIGVVIIFFIEDFGSVGITGKFNRLFYSLYTIVSGRTAGFDPVNITNFSTFSIFTIIIFMWIGGSPGGTSGGIKNTTLGVLILHLINYLRGRKHLHFGHRRIDPITIEKSQVIFFATFIATILSISLLVLFEPNNSFLVLVFEAVSAISLTGFSLGGTADLGNPAKYVLIFTMYIGRIGVLVFLASFFKEKDKLLYDYPDEKVIVG